MEYPKITKIPFEQYSVKPNLRDYRMMCEEFSWDKVSRELDWSDREHINIGSKGQEGSYMGEQKRRGRGLHLPGSITAE
jgi:hypothetical protein